MGILARSKNKSAKEVKGGAGEGGYIAEFVKILTANPAMLRTIIKKNIKVVTNAGGMNPLGCKAAIEAAVAAAGIDPKLIKVGVVLGDDITNRVDEFLAQKKLSPFLLDNIETESISDLEKPNRVMSLNAYFGAQPIAEALAAGANIVVTGRCVDSALAVGPLLYEFNSFLPQSKDSASFLDFLSLSSLAGHILECGCQATGGNFTDWKIPQSCGWENVGFPIVEFSMKQNQNLNDLHFIVTKPEGTGGAVTSRTVSEQILYEISDPENYILPDVICDWSNISVTQHGTNQVCVSGAKGKPPTPYYKCSGTTTDGSLKLVADVVYAGIDAATKAKIVGDTIMRRASAIIAMRGLEGYKETLVEVIGSEHCFGEHADPNVRSRAREVVLRLSVIHNKLEALGIFGKEIAPVALSMAPGAMGSAGGRPNPQPVIKHVSVLIPKSLLDTTVNVGADFKKTITWQNPNYSSVSPVKSIDRSSGGRTEVKRRNQNEETKDVMLIDLCLGRSGDKGDTANIGIIVRESEWYEYLDGVLTAERVREYMKHVIADGGRVVKYKLPGLQAFNFLLTKSLGGGGLSSLRVDRQGKAYAQVLLTMKVPVPKSWNVSPSNGGNPTNNEENSKAKL
eukprot:TRINITY_DN23098_c0_g1_i1.p1 TRINITY_DN23098_c0_g1~~TRINITY_DN23098_c0_g1_i1.p1  ORF type:complete len:663 (-),score=158.87 TRINITY_DN23098_c0_g1_i1:48-1916(-)